jgi:hypothetical protein
MQSYTQTYLTQPNSAWPDPIPHDLTSFYSTQRDPKQPDPANKTQYNTTLLNLTKPDLTHLIRLHPTHLNLPLPGEPGLKRANSILEHEYKVCKWASDIYKQKLSYFKK